VASVDVVEGERGMGAGGGFRDGAGTVTAPIAQPPSVAGGNRPRESGKGG